MKVEIGSIRIRDRVRKETGDVDALAESLRRHGQLNPVTITRDHELVAGHRRMLAARRLGWKTIEAVVVDADSAIEKLEIELEENVHRKDFSPAELLDGYRQLDRLKHPPIGRRIVLYVRDLFARLFRRGRRTRNVSPAMRAESPDQVARVPVAASGGAPIEDPQTGQYGV